MSWWRPSRWTSNGRAARRTRQVAARIAEAGPLLAPGPSQEFRDNLRAELLRDHRAQRSRGVRAEPLAERPRSRPRPLVARVYPTLIFGVLLAVMFSTGVQTYDSVPGDLLYPLKRAAESTLLCLAHDDEERAEQEMASARQRAVETILLLAESAPERRRLIAQTLDDMETTTRSALTRVVRPGEARRFAKEQHMIVERILPKLDRENRSKARKYLRLIDNLVVSPP